MWHILGVGAALPSTEIGNPLLLELGTQIQGLEGLIASSGITRRRSVFHQEYLRTTANRDLLHSSNALAITPTDLAVRACTEALERAGITKEEVGLIIGECTTPEQTTPSEAQRVAGVLGMKVSAYDISAPLISPLQVIDLFSSWREEKLPEFILFFTVNTPTRAIDYATRTEGIYFGDGVGAFVLSPRRKKGLAVLDITVEPTRFSSASITIRSPGYLEMSPELPGALRAANEHAFERAIAKCALRPEIVQFIGSVLTIQDAEQLAGPKGVLDLNIWHNSGVYGYALGATPLIALSEHWDRFGDRAEIVITAAAPACGAGWMVLKPAN